MATLDYELYYNTAFYYWSPRVPFIRTHLTIEKTVQ